MSSSKMKASTSNSEMKGADSSSRRVSLILSVSSVAGDLSQALHLLKTFRSRVLHVESRRSQQDDESYEVFVDIDPQGVDVDDVISGLRAYNCTLLAPDRAKPPAPLRKTVSLDKGETKYMPNGLPWFPRIPADLDISSNRVLMYGDELDADHPGFKDEVYRKRRKEFAESAFRYKHGQLIPFIEYTAEEVKTWGTIFRELNKLYPTHACKEYLHNLPLLKEHCGYREDALPQLETISNYLKQKTGFSLRPVAGYLSSRDFLAGLAFRVFHCTQYIRHPSDPFYTPEPDCCHELLGHMPLFLDPSFAEFSQEIGLASLGASDQEVQKLATCYFFTIEFGLCRQEGELRVYGAGLLSSVGELRHVLSEEAVVKPFDPEVTCQAVCQITTYQDAYFFSNSFEEAKEKLRGYARTIKKPFELRYDPYTQRVEVLDKPRSVAKAADDLQQQLNVIASALHKMTR